jgi:hypothetical protein
MDVQHEQNFFLLDAFEMALRHHRQGLPPVVRPDARLGRVPQLFGSQGYRAVSRPA